MHSTVNQSTHDSKSQAQLKDDRALLQNKAKFVLCHSSSGHKHALEEVLTQPVRALRKSLVVL